IGTTQRALQLCSQFQRLNIPGLGIEDQSMRILLHYKRELENVAKHYTKYKEDPPLPRDMPPISGKIVWVRQLYHRIEDPMNILRHNTELLASKDGRIVVKQYNKLAQVLITYELVFYQAWLQQVNSAREGLKVTLLIRDEQTREIYVNLDPDVLSLTRETDNLLKLGFEIPSSATMIQSSHNILQQHASRLNLLLHCMSDIKAKFPPEYKSLIIPHLTKLRQMLEPGLTHINWTSLKVGHFIDQVQAELDHLRWVADRVNDILKFRIEGTLEGIIGTVLCDLPEDGRNVTLQELCDTTYNLCNQAAETMQIQSKSIKEATLELIELLCGDLEAFVGDPLDLDQDRTSHSPDRQSALQKRRDIRESIEKAADELYHHFQTKTTDAIIKSVKSNLENLRKRICTSVHSAYGK
ncbi:Dynein heavy chain 5, axonemal, partial [Cichlidogyrus casuarinus]